MSDLGNCQVFADNLKFYMKSYKMTQQELANICGVAQSTVNSWICGQKYPRIDKIEIIANHFGIKKSNLVEKMEEKAPTSGRDRSIEMAMNLFKQLTPEEKLDLICYASEILNRRGEH